MYILCLNNSLLLLFPQTNQIKPNLKNICPEVRFQRELVYCSFALSIYIRGYICNVTNMFQFVSTNLFFKFCRNIASVLIFCPDNSKSVNVSREISKLSTFSVFQYVYSYFACLSVFLFLFYNVYKEKMFTIEIEHGREAF